MTVSGHRHLGVEQGPTGHDGGRPDADAERLGRHGHGELEAATGGVTQTGGIISSDSRAGWRHG